jgi:hypothetical protein
MTRSAAKKKPGPRPPTDPNSDGNADAEALFHMAYTYMEDIDIRTAKKPPATPADAAEHEHGRVMDDPGWRAQLEKAITAYARGNISVGRAAELGNVSVPVMRVALRRRGVRILSGHGGSRAERLKTAKQLAARRRRA